MNPQNPVPETISTNADDTPSLPFSNPDCSFCAIVTAYPPISPTTQSSLTLDQHLDPAKLDPPAYVLLSTENVIAFLDVYPLTRGHVLVCPRKHIEKVGGMAVKEGREIGGLLPLLSRAVTFACMPDIAHADVDYNLVQNNGPGAAQVVPHAHFHIVPRYPFEYSPPSTSELATVLGEIERGVGEGERRGAGLGNNEWNKADVRRASGLPEGLEATRILFGRGQRHYRDEEDAEVLIRMMRQRVRVECEREFGDTGNEEAGANLEGSNGVQDRMTRERPLPFKGGGGKL